MTHTRLISAAWLALATAGTVLAQIPQPQPLPSQPLPQPQPVPGQPDGVEVLARGPVHEAFASTAEMPAPGPIVAKRPPDPVEELPPDQKPAGDNVQWIPGYWHWDEDRTDFIWISGFWRQLPPGRVWVPGGWREARGGYQWVQGFWNVATPQQQQPAQIEYLPPPPAPLEIGPAVPAPSETCFYTPGVWQWRGNRFAWRPGFWVEHRPNWVWVPAHYRWTPAGYVFIDGFWDHTLAARGVLFAPVAFRPAVLVQPRFVYTPAYVVTDTSLYGSMFVRRGWGCYYFGDYFEPVYARQGYTAWCGASLRIGNFAVGVEIGRRPPPPVFDPLWSYYSVAYRHEPRWQAGVTDLYAGRYRGDFARPPHTLVQQNTLVQNVTNITNTNVNVIQNTNNSNVMLTRLADVRPAAAPTTGQIAAQPGQLAALRAVPQADRVKEQQLARELRQVAAQRQKLETGLVDRGRAVARTTDAPQAVKLDIPKAVAARAQTPASLVVPEAPKPASERPHPPRTIPPANPLLPPAPPIPQPVKVKPEQPLVQPKPPVNNPNPLLPPTVQPPKQPNPPVTNPVQPPKKPNPVQPPVLQPPKQPNPTPQPPVNPLVPPPQPKPPTPQPPKPPVLPPPTIQPPKPSAPVVPPQPQPPPKPVPPPVLQPPPKPKPPAPQPPAVQPPKPPAPPPVVAPQPQPRPAPPPAPVVQPPKPPAPPPAPVSVPKPPVTAPPPAPKPQPPVTQPQPPKPAPPPAPPATPRTGPQPKPKDKGKDSQ